MRPHTALELPTANGLHASPGNARRRTPPLAADWGGNGEVTMPTLKLDSTTRSVSASSGRSHQSGLIGSCSPQFGRPGTVAGPLRGVANIGNPTIGSTNVGWN